MTTLPQRICSPDRRDGTVTFIDGEEATPARWSELDRDAKGMAVALAARGIGPGSHVAVLGPTTRPLVTTIEATWLAGATVVVLPLPMRMSSIEEFVEETRNRILRADVDLLVIDPDLAPFLTAEPGDPPAVGYADVIGVADPTDYQIPPVRDDELAILQFTSGSTSAPKGVMLPHHTLLANVDAILGALEVVPDQDVAVSWLPLYHDMGLVGILTSSMVTGTDLVLAGAQTFMASPARWVRWLSEYRGSITAGPNFAWILATRAMNRLDDLDLSHLRVALNGAEPVDFEAMHALVAAGERHGLAAGAVFPAFGMAEVCIAGTFPGLGTGLRTDAIDQARLEHERVAVPVDADDEGAKVFAQLGRAMDGLEIRVVDQVTGAVLLDREVGELQIRGTSVFAGYYGDPDRTAEAFDGDWFRTGDLAYLIDGELVLCGRIKDVIIVGGRNVYPEDVERRVAEVEGVRAGNVIAFGVNHRRRGEGVVVVAETKADGEGLHEVRSGVEASVRRAVGLSADDIVLVAPGSLPKTSSGKVQRALCRARYLDEELQVV